MQVGSKTYTASQYKSLFQRAGMADEFTKYTNATNISTWMAPNVPTHCFYGLDPDNNNTAETLIYESAYFPNRRPTSKLNGLGDTVVNVQISELCQQWANQSATFNYRTYNVTHSEIVTDPIVLAAIGKVVGASTDFLSSKT